MPLENGKIICGVQECKYLGAIFDKKGSSQKEIAGRIIKGRKEVKTITELSSMGQKNENNNKKKTIYGSIVQSECTHAWSRGMGGECKK